MYLKHSLNEKLQLLSRYADGAEVEQICFNYFKSVFNHIISVTQDDLSNFLGETSSNLKFKSKRISISCEMASKKWNFGV